MIHSFDHLPLWLYSHPCDMRKSFDGLCGIVQNHLHKDPVRDGVFVFINKQLNKMKILYFSRGGFWLLYKRLEQGRFQRPDSDAESQSIQIDSGQLYCMIEGFDIHAIRRKKRFSLQA